jgi:uncharacterized membrane protein
VLTIVILSIVFRAMASVLAPVFSRVAQIPAEAVDAISVVALVALLYFIGVGARLLLGRRLIALGEAIATRIPLVGTVYGSTKQVVQAVAHTDQKAFQRVVWVGFPQPALRALAFVTGTVEGPSGEAKLLLFVPTAPNPTSGFLVLVAGDEVSDAGISVDEAIRTIVSGGILVPPQLAASGTRQADVKA